jgi:hypothetical protein
MNEFRHSAIIHEVSQELFDVIDVKVVCNNLFIQQHAYMLNNVIIIEINANVEEQLFFYVIEY